MGFNNGLGSRLIAPGMPTAQLVESFRRHTARTEQRIEAGDQWAAHPSQMGMGMVLEARGNVYGDVRTVDPAVVAKRRAKNKAARAARRIGRK